MFREGILNGSPDLKEQTAKAIGESIKYLTPAALKPSVVGITGNNGSLLRYRVGVLPLLLEESRHFVSYVAENSVFMSCGSIGRVPHTLQCSVLC